MDTEYTDDIRDMMGSLRGKLNVISGINRAGKSHALSIFAQIKENNIFYHHYKVDAMINHKWNRFCDNHTGFIPETNNKTIKDLCNAINLIKPNISKIFLLSNLGDNRYQYYSDYKIMHSVYESLQKNPDWKSIEWDLYRKILNQYDTNIIYLLFNIIEPSLFFLPQKQKYTNIHLPRQGDGSVHVPYEVAEYWKKTFAIRLNDFLYNDVLNPNIANDNFDKNKFNEDLIALCDKINKYDSPEKYNRIIPADYEKSLTNSIQPFNLLNSPSDGQKSIMALIMISFFIEKGYNFLSNAGTLVNNKPDYILLDEPDAFLNPQIIQTMLEIIREEFVDKDIKVIMTTHNPVTLQHIKNLESAQIVWMENGKIDKTKEADEIILDLLDVSVAAIYNHLENLRKISDKAYIIFCEGKFDVMHLEKAIDLLAKELKIDRKKYHFFDCGGAQEVHRIINFAVNQVAKRLALFDNDAEGIECKAKVDAIKKDNKQQYKSMFVSDSQNNTIEDLYGKDIIENWLNNKPEGQKMKYIQGMFSNSSTTKKRLAKYVRNANDEEDIRIIKEKFKPLLTNIIKSFK